MDSNVDFISSIISLAENDVLSDDGKTVARYRANVESFATMSSVVDTNIRSVVFNVGGLPKASARVATPGPHNGAIDGSFLLTDVVRAEIEGSIRKVHGQTGSWHYVDFSGLVAGLASGLAYYRLFGELDMNVLKGGDDAAVPYAFTALRAAASEVTADSGKVYLPAFVASQMNKGAMAALVGVANGLGAHVMTDAVAVTADNQAVIPKAYGSDLAMGCYNALSLLGRFYNANGKGELFSFLVTVGTHRLMTVHGHTDEGGFMRELLRKIKFCTPYGGLAVGQGDFAGLPKPSGPAGIVKLVDGIALQTAGLVHLADPMVVLGGAVYPTTIVSGHKRDAAEQSAVDAARVARSDPNLGSDGDALSNSAKVREVMGDFAQNFSRLLGRLMGVEGGSVEVCKFIDGTHSFNIDAVYSHLKYEVVNPFFWVESTGSTRVDCSDMPCQKSGFGRLCAARAPEVHPMFHGMEVLQSNESVTAGTIKWVGARRHALLHHLQGHKLNGLSNLQIRALTAAKLTNFGHGAREADGSRPREESLKEKVEAERGVDKFLWGRGHSALIAPGEMLYSGGKIGVLMRHVAGDVYSPERTHFPRSDELTGTVEFRVSPLERLGVAKPDARYSAEDKRRKGAARALSEARIKIIKYRDVSALMPASVEEEPDLPLEDDGAGVVVANDSTPGDVYTEPGTKLKPSGTHGSQVLPKTGQNTLASGQSGATAQAPKGVSPAVSTAAPPAVV